MIALELPDHPTVILKAARTLTNLVEDILEDQVLLIVVQSRELEVIHELTNLGFHVLIANHLDVLIGDEHVVWSLLTDQCDGVGIDQPQDHRNGVESFVEAIGKDRDVEITFVLLGVAGGDRAIFEAVAIGEDELLSTHLLHQDIQSFSDIHALGKAKVHEGFRAINNLLDRIHLTGVHLIQLEHNHFLL